MIWQAFTTIVTNQPTGFYTRHLLNPFSIIIPFSNRDQMQLSVGGKLHAS